jgi:hypothetical protein
VPLEALRCASKKLKLAERVPRNKQKVAARNLSALCTSRPAECVKVVTKKCGVVLGYLYLNRPQPYVERISQRISRELEAKLQYSKSTTLRYTLTTNLPHESPIVLLVLVLPIWLFAMGMCHVVHCLFMAAWIPSRRLHIPQWACTTMRGIRSTFAKDDPLRHASVAKMLCWLDEEMAQSKCKVQSETAGSNGLRSSVCTIANNTLLVVVYGNGHPSTRVVIVRPMAYVVSVIPKKDGQLLDAPLDANVLGWVPKHVPGVIHVHTKSAKDDDEIHELVPIPFLSPPDNIEMSRSELREMVVDMLANSSPTFAESHSQEKARMAELKKTRMFELDEHEKTEKAVAELEEELRSGSVSPERFSEIFEQFKPSSAAARAEMRAGAAAGVPAEVDGEPCTICLDDYGALWTHARWPGCGHVFHEHCILDWARLHNTCPLCRREVPAADVSLGYSDVAVMGQIDAFVASLRRLLMLQVASR